MNRTVVRLFGVCIAFVGLGSPYIHAETATTTPGGTTPVACPTSTTPAIPSGCHLATTGTVSGVKYTQYNCGIPITGWISPNLDLYECKMVDKGGMAPFSGCADGYCNETGIYCPDGNYFESLGCVRSEYPVTKCYYNSGTIYAPSSGNDSVIYLFNGCAAGYYQTCGPSGSGIVHMCNDSVSGLVGNCGPCSGLRLVNGNFETYAAAGSTGAGGFVWDSPSGNFITTCRAYASSAIQDDTGTFTISASGCPYIE